jgi:hypothetical protein
MSMIKGHEKTMAALARDISRKADHDVIANLTKQVDHCVNDSHDLQRDLQFQHDHSVSDMRRSLNDTTDGLTNEMRLLKSQFDSASAQLKNAQILIDEANKRSDANEQKLREVLNLFDPSTKELLFGEIANLKESIQNIVSQKALGGDVVLPPNELDDHVPHPPSAEPPDGSAATGRRSSRSERDSQGDPTRLPPLGEDRFSSGWTSRRSSGSRKGYSDAESDRRHDRSSGSSRRAHDGRLSYASGPRDLDGLSDAIPEGPSSHSKLPDIHSALASADGSSCLVTLCSMHRISKRNPSEAGLKSIWCSSTFSDVP